MKQVNPRAIWESCYSAGTRTVAEDHTDDDLALTVPNSRLTHTIYMLCKR